MNRFLGPHLFVVHFPGAPSLMFLWRSPPCSGSPDPEQLHGGDGRRGGHGVHGDRGGGGRSHVIGPSAVITVVAAAIAAVLPEAM